MSYCKECCSVVYSNEEVLDQLECHHNDFCERVRTDLVEKFINKIESHPILGKVYSSLSGCDRRFFEDSIKEEIDRFVKCV